MKNINITNIVDPTSLQPFTGNSLKFLQDASSEARAGMIKAFITQNLGSYSLTVPYVISGCVYSGTTPNFAVTAGEIFYGGEYYEVTAVSNYTNIPQFKLDQTQDATADPLDFSDGQTWSVHDIFKFIGEDTVTAKVFDATDLVSVYGTKTATEYANASQADSSGSYVYMTTLTHTTTKTAKYKVTLYANPRSVKAATGLPPLDEQIGAKFRIYNATDSAVIDEKTVENRIKWDSAGAAASTLDVTGQWSIVCSRILTINAGKTIKCQFHTQNGTTTTTDNYFTVEEL